MAVELLCRVKCPGYSQPRENMLSSLQAMWAYRAALISVSKALSQTQAYGVRLQTQD